MLRFLKVSWRNFDWILFFSSFILSLVGLSTIYSVDLSRGDILNFTSRQVIALVLAILVFFISSFLHVTFYESAARPVYFLAIVLLIAVLFLGVTIRGTTGWFRFFGFSFQPAEFAKVALVILLAWRIERQARRFDKWQFVLVMFTLTLVLVGLILLQPDLGSASILLAVCFGLLVLVGTKKKYIFGIITMAILAGVVGWFFIFQDYQKDRIMTFIDPTLDPLGSGYNVTQSIIAVGSGQFLGRGLGFGSQSQLHFLPEAQTDFIVSVIGEELGFVGFFIVLALYFILLWRLVNMAYNARNDFASFLPLGVSLVFFSHIVVNIGAAVGLLPVTGVTLPFLSYGGSSLIINFLLLGIAESAARSS
ncbi:MAG: rod shape-determining protein RodA [Candidatus Magasanikbacteria bacterium CG_4_10_14_0_2_um_filter_33_14]|uniref:Rod shape-determining protein RodA n=1 Tax=Candidatus Magasanikbacteria bacterium CG_4_10_14_0_2_um_filter_33_14 TaxID=1974636 RepID=A0A2M7V8E3_9BACT|nr:MAG: rod shape-determining protein RodA [Candidatus Magasanikbacteria bacterium CG_4_10_14_0_2_um_filter_33_14]